MDGQRRAFLTIAGVVLLLAAAAAEQSKPAVPPPAQTTPRPNDEGAAPSGKLVAPVRGQAELGFTNPVSKRVGHLIVTTIKVKNLSKGAIPAMTRMFAVELAERNPKVRVNAVLPGPVMLPAHLSEAERSQAIAATLVRREGTPVQVAQAVWALVENEFVTGTCLPVDGGRTIAP